jgi:uncharacterized protein YuzE
MASTERPIEIAYDERADVLYASIGAPQQAVSYEVSEDLLLRYVPPGRELVGITIMNFSRHYPLDGSQSLLSHANSIIRGLLEEYPYVPLFMGEAEIATCGVDNPSHHFIEYTDPHQAQVVFAGRSTMAAQIQILETMPQKAKIEMTIAQATSQAQEPRAIIQTEKGPSWTSSSPLFAITLTHQSVSSTH